jgi:hypothetical protein
METVYRLPEYGDGWRKYKDKAEISSTGFSLRRNGKRFLLEARFAGGGGLRASSFGC